MMTAVRGHESALGRWETVTRAPDARLRPYVRPYVGFSEHLVAVPRRLETPSDIVPLIISFTPGFRITGPTHEPAGEFHRSFVAGLADSYVYVEATGPAEGLQIDLTPLGAYRLLGVPMHTLANRTIELDEILGSGARSLAERLHAAPGWESRFALLDAALAARIADGPKPEAGVAFTWRRLRETHGRIAVSALADALSWNRKQLVARCREQLGLPPKTIGRVLRFQQATVLLRQRPDAPLATIAAAAGYYDQPHFNRDFRAFAGASPGAYASRLLPDGGGVSGD